MSTRLSRHGFWFVTLLMAISLTLTVWPGVDSVRGADWERLESTVLSIEDPQAMALRLEPKSAEAPPVDAHVVVFDPTKFRLRVVDDPGKQLKNLKEAMERAGALAGVNGGYFHEDNTPLGLLVSGGTVVHAQETAALLTGLIVVTDKGNMQMLRPKEYKGGKSTREALQAGPFLVDGGATVAGLNDKKVARRTVVAQLADGRWALISLSPLTLADAGALLATDGLWPGGKTLRALNLDGGSSTGFYLKDKPVYLAEFSKVRNYVALVRREP